MKLLILILLCQIFVPGSSLSSFSNRGIKKPVLGSIESIRKQLDNIRTTLHGGIRIQELRALKNYLVGYDSSEVAEIDAEIEALLSLAEEEYGPLQVKESADYGSIGDSEEYTGLDTGKYTGSDAGKYTGSGTGKYTGSGTEKYTGLDAEKYLGADTKYNYQYVNPTKPDYDNVCYRPPVPLTISHTVVVTASQSPIEHIILNVDGTMTQNITVTSVYRYPTTIEETVTVQKTPQLIVSTEYLTKTSLYTILTYLKNDAIITDSRVISHSEIAVETAYSPFLTNSPAYVTTTVTDYQTESNFMTLTQVESSTMTFDKTEAIEISVTSTMTKSLNIEKIVTQTEYTKIFVTSTSVFQIWQTVTKCEPKGFFEAVKKKWG